MIQDSKANGFNIPTFSVDGDIVKVTFPNIKHLREEVAKNDIDSRHYFERIIEGIKKCRHIPTAKVYGRLTPADIKGIVDEYRNME